jgi:hypothetical protein
MNDAERWINLQGPPPAGIREMLEAAREPWAPIPWTPELAEELERDLYAALAAQKAQRARRRRMQTGLVVGAFALAAAAVLVVWLRAGAPVPGLVGDVGLAATKLAPVDLAGAVAPSLPSASPSARPRDASPPKRR